MKVFGSASLIASLLFKIGSSLCDDTCDVCLTSASFEAGTYRVIDSGKYCLDEDIEFNPLPGSIDSPNTEFDWFPSDTLLYPGSDIFREGAYALGFFAAIAIETDNVEIDLCAQTIGQHLHHYLQQRFFAVIEISKSPFLEGVGPTTFGAADPLTNITIHNGVIGLSSHQGIHSNEANQVLLENLIIRDFEVAGIQMNGFTGVIMRDITIGPSATDVQPAGYYSNAKFLALAYKKMLDAMGTEAADSTTVSFAGGRVVSVQDIYDDLMQSMDIAFRFFIGESTAEDQASELYDISIELFSNPVVPESIVFNGRNRGNGIITDTARLPDGSSLYGIVLHSRNLAVFGYGQFENLLGDGEDILIENVAMSDLRMSVNEIPAVYFDECGGDLELRTVVKGPFADVMDLRKMVGIDQIDVIDSGIVDDILALSYVGNPLSDAQIALAVHGPQFEAEYNTNGQDSDSHFLMWALDGFEAGNYDVLPSCVNFMCNGDIMLHTNKGLIGARFDFIENITIRNMDIDGLSNESPLSSFACLNYTGAHDGGNPNQLDLEGTMGTDVKGIVMYGSDAVFEETTVIRQLISNNGDAVGIHLMADSIALFDESTAATVSVQRIITGAAVTDDILAELEEADKTPYPNNFFSCNVLLDDGQSADIIDGDGVFIDPNPPNGIPEILCLDGVSAAGALGRNN